MAPYKVIEACKARDWLRLGFALFGCLYDAEMIKLRELRKVLVNRDCKWKERRPICAQIVQSEWCQGPELGGFSI